MNKNRIATATLAVSALSAALSAAGCMVGPTYRKPDAPSPPAFHEPVPEGWKEAQPDDGKIRGKWWEVFDDPGLNALEEQVNISNQNVLAAEAQYRAAKDAVRIVRAGLFPTVSTNPSIGVSRTPAGTSTVGSGSGGGIRRSFDLPFDLSYQADVWGGIRRGVRASAETAQASAAELENARLSFQAQLAQDYFQLRATRSDQELLTRTVKAFEEFLELTRNRMRSGVASGADVAQAETQLHGAQAQLIELDVARTQLEHAISILIGKPPTDIASAPLAPKIPPQVPIGVPSALLERRPDIAAAERRMASANEEIGIAKVAYYPSLNITAAAGFSAASFTRWLAWPSRFWTLGASSAEILFDAGKRRGQVAQAQDLYDVSVANYRQTVLVAFQQVEDHLAALRVLENEAKAEDAAVQSADRALTIVSEQYRAGTTSYLQVIISQTAALQAHRLALDLLGRRMIAGVLLIEALGGGWDASGLPSTKDVMSGH